jgi:hypothetical protein
MKVAYSPLFLDPRRVFLVWLFTRSFSGIADASINPDMHVYKEQKREKRATQSNIKI